MYTYHFDFVTVNENYNKLLLDRLSSKTFAGRSCVEIVEKLFNITFASGIENGKAVFLTLDGEDSNNDYLSEKYDGKVSLTTPPLDHEIGKQFPKTKLTFKVEEKEIGNGFVELKGYINSKFRNKLMFS
jgi:hypothetical protein